MHPFAPRPIRFHSVRGRAGWRLKLYSIRFGDAAIDWPRFDAGMRLAERSLPQPAAAPGRPGLGFLIAHQGRTADYLVLAWWDNENELPIRVFVRGQGDSTWRPARESESCCVWDLEVIWFEREAYVTTMLAGPRDDPAADYLARFLETH